MKLSAKKNGKGYITSYTISIGSAEARECGFIDEDGKPLEIEKIIKNAENKIELKLKN